jgi:hypothetical protein
MRQWLLIDAEGDPLDQRVSVSVRAFTSGDADEPAEGDLAGAVRGLAAGRAVRRDGERLDFVLVPLDDAQAITFAIREVLDIVSRGNVVL